MVSDLRLKKFKFICTIFFGICALLAFGSGRVEAATCTSTATGAWFAAATWTGGGCTGGGGIPGTADLVIINTTVTFNTTATVTNITVNSGKTLRENSSAGTLTLTKVTGTTFLNSGGTVSLGAYTSVVMNGNGGQTATSGAMTLFNLSLTPTITANRTWTIGSGGLTINGNFTINPTAASAYNLAVNMAGAITVASTGLTTITGTTSGTSHLNPTATDYAFTTGRLTIGASGTLYGQAATITITSSANTNPVTNNGVFVYGTSTFVYSGPLNATNVEAANFDDSGAAGENAYYNLTVAPSAAVIFRIGAAAADSLSIHGSLVIGDGVYASTVRASSYDPYIYINGDLTINSGTTFTKGATAGFIFELTTSSAVIRDHNTTPQDLGTVIIGNSLAKTVSLGTNVKMTDVDIWTGTFSLGTYTLTLTGTAAIGNFSGGICNEGGSGTFTAGTSTVKYTGDGTVNPNSSCGGALTFYNVEFSPVLTSNRSYTFQTGAITISNNFTAQPTTSGTWVLSVNLGATTTVGGTTLIDSVGTAYSKLFTLGYTFSTVNLTLGTGCDFTPAASTINISGNITNGGNFNYGTSTINLTGGVGTTQILTHNLDFYNLSVTGGASRTIRFESGHGYAVYNNLTLTGGSCGTYLLLRGSTTSAWTLQDLAGGTTSVSYVDVSYSTATTTAITASTSYDSLNNTNWTINAGACGTLTVDIVDGSGVSVGSPSITMTPKSVTILYGTTTGTLGTSTQKIRVNNTTNAPRWSLAMAATSGPTAFWDGTARDYDFNDTTAGAGDGADADSLGGLMTVNPAVATVTPQGGCTSTGLTLGSSASFDQVGSVNSITLASTSAAAMFHCYWDFTGIGISQTVPASMPIGTYSINMTLTVTAI